MMDGAGPLGYRLDGAGAPLLLLNGGMMSLAAWEPLMPPLAARFQVVRCDLRGQLRSPGAPPPDLAGHAGDLVALLDHLGIDSCHVVGTSFGGLVGLTLSALHPGRVRSLVAVTVGDHATPELARGMGQLDEACQLVLNGGSPARLGELMAAFFYSPAYVAANREAFAARTAQLAQLPRGWWEGLSGLLRTRFDLRPLLPQVACPTLVMAAAQDIVFLPERGRAVADAIPGARFELVPDSGHVLIQERPLVFTEVCVGFLEAVAVGPLKTSKVEGRRSTALPGGPESPTRPGSRKLNVEGRRSPARPGGPESPTRPGSRKLNVEGRRSPARPGGPESPTRPGSPESPTRPGSRKLNVEGRRSPARPGHSDPGIRPSTVDLEPGPHPGIRPSTFDLEPDPHPGVRPSTFDLEPGPHPGIRPSTVDLEPGLTPGIRPSTFDLEPGPTPGVRPSTFDLEPGLTPGIRPSTFDLEPGPTPGIRPSTFDLEPGPHPGIRPSTFDLEPGLSSGEASTKTSPLSREGRQGEHA